MKKVYVSPAISVESIEVDNVMGSGCLASVQGDTSLCEVINNHGQDGVQCPGSGAQGKGNDTVLCWTDYDL